MENQENATQHRQKFTANDLKIMQSWSLKHKIEVSITRIIEFYTKFPDKIYVSFSGGKDSTVLLHLVRSVYPDTPAVFVDTGLEYPELREFVKTIDNVTWLKPDMNFKQVIQTYGYPIGSKDIAQKVEAARRGASWVQKYVDGTVLYNGKKSSYCLSERWKQLINAPFKVSRSCCNVMKKKPGKTYQKKSGKHPILGTMACESIMRKNAWRRNGCNAFDSKEPKSQPMSFWTEQDVLEYISRFIKPKYDKAWQSAQYSHGSIRKKARKFLRKNGYLKNGIAPVYGEIKQDDNGKYYTTGCDRTGCVFCGFGCHLEKEPNRFQRLKQTHPKLWDYCMRDMDKGGLGMQKVLDFIGVKTE